MADVVPNQIPIETLVGSKFLQKYYETLNKNPLMVHRFYEPVDSVLTYSIEGLDGNAPGIPTIARGQKEIARVIELQNHVDSKAEIISFDCQLGPANSVIIQATGFLYVSGNRQKFCQSFVLQNTPEDPRCYRVRNDILRFIPDSVYTEVPEVVDNQGAYFEGEEAESTLSELGTPNSFDVPPTETFVVTPEPVTLVTVPEPLLVAPVPVQITPAGVVKGDTPPVPAASPAVPEFGEPMSYAKSVRPKRHPAGGKVPPKAPEVQSTPVPEVQASIPTPAPAPAKDSSRKPGSGVGAPNRGQESRFNPTEESTSVFTLFPQEISDQDLRAAFQAFGNVSAFKPLRREVTEKKAPSCKCEYALLASAQEAVKAARAGKFTVMGHTLKVDFFKMNVPKHQHHHQQQQQNHNPPPPQQQPQPQQPQPLHQPQQRGRNTGAGRGPAGQNQNGGDGNRRSGQGQRAPPNL